MAVIMSREIVLPKYSWSKYKKATTYSMSSSTITSTRDFGVSGNYLICSASEPSHVEGHNYISLKNYVETTVGEYANGSMWKSYPYVGTNGPLNNTTCYKITGSSTTSTSGDTKYVFNYTKIWSLSKTYSKGDYIGKVYSSDENKYPDDGYSGDYWYVKVVS